MPLFHTWSTFWTTYTATIWNASVRFSDNVKIVVVLHSGIHIHPVDTYSTEESAQSGSIQCTFLSLFEESMKSNGHTQTIANHSSDGNEYRKKSWARQVLSLPGRIRPLHLFEERSFIAHKKHISYDAFMTDLYFCYFIDRQYGGYIQYKTQIAKSIGSIVMKANEFRETSVNISQDANGRCI